MQFNMNSLDSAIITRKSQYLFTILNPQLGETDIPDDNIRPHIRKGETITYNIVSTTGSGLFILYPNSPTSLVGFHYTRDAQGQLTFDQRLEVAQELGKSYTYGRKISQLLTLTSSTIPSGVYALNGTFNAVRFEGQISEVTDLSYDKILRLSANLDDKAANVLVGDGLIIPTYPLVFDLPYVRLHDPVPSTGQAWAEDDQRSLSYVYTQQLAAINTGDDTEIGTFQFNCEAFSSFWVYLDIVSQNTSSLNTPTYNMVLEFKGLGGNVLGTSTADLFPNEYKKENRPTTVCFYHQAFQEPVISVAGTVYGTVQGTYAKPSDLTVTIRVPLASLPGYVSPTYVVNYQSVATNSTLTLSGYANYELIPNSQLQQNLPLYYAKTDPADLTYVKLVMANRTKLGLKSIFKGPEYQALIRQLTAYTDLDDTPQTLSFWKFLHGIKRIAVPLVSTIFPPAAPIAGAVGALMDKYIPKSMSGVLGGPNSMSGKIGGPLTWAVDVPHTASELLQLPNSRNPRLALLPIEGQPYLLVPAVYFSSMTAKPFILLPVTREIKQAWPDLEKRPYIEYNGHKVFGVQPKRELLPGPLINYDMLIAPLLSMRQGKAIIRADSRPVQGDSHQLAVLLLSRMMEAGITTSYPALFTGGILSNRILRPGGYMMKDSLAKTLGVKLFTGKEFGWDANQVMPTVVSQVLGSEKLLQPIGTEKLLSVGLEREEALQDMLGAPYTLEANSLQDLYARFPKTLDYLDGVELSDEVVLSLMRNLITASAKAQQARRDKVIMAWRAYGVELTPGAASLINRGPNAEDALALSQNLLPESLQSMEARILTQEERRQNVNTNQTVKENFIENYPLQSRDRVRQTLEKWGGVPMPTSYETFNKEAGVGKPKSMRLRNQIENLTQGLDNEIKEKLYSWASETYSPSKGLDQQAILRARDKLKELKTELSVPIKSVTPSKVARKIEGLMATLVKYPDLKHIPTQELKNRVLSLLEQRGGRWSADRDELKEMRAILAHGERPGPSGPPLDKLTRPQPQPEPIYLPTENEPELTYGEISDQEIEPESGSRNGEESLGESLARMRARRDNMGTAP